MIANSGMDEFQGAGAPVASAPCVQDTEFFDTAGLAKYLNVSPKAIVKWRDARRIPGAVRIGRIWRFRRNEIEKKLLSGVLLLSTK